MEKKVKCPELVPAYVGFRNYVGFLLKQIYLKELTYIDREHIPEYGVPTVVVSNHQNSLIDALGIIYSMPDRKTHFITRGDVFKIHPLVSKLFYGLGLLPSYRLNYEGAGALKNNANTFKVASDNLLKGNTVGIYPEAGHQDKHWLGHFSYGYLRMVFQAVEDANFEKEIFVLPACNHYDRYDGLRVSTLVRFGTPISLKPYYELYKTRPRTAQRQVNALVRAQIKSMMLDIEDVDHYYQIDYIRNSEYGQNYAKSLGLSVDKLPQKMESDKKLVAGLLELPCDVTSPIYDDVALLTSQMKQRGLSDEVLRKAPTVFQTVLNVALLVVLLPLAVSCFLPSIFGWIVPQYFTKKLKDPMFEGSFLVGLNALAIVPIVVLLTFIIGWCKFSLLFAILSVLLLPLMWLFEWFYYGRLKKTIGQFRYFATPKDELKRLRSMRRSIYDRLDNNLK